MDIKTKTLLFVAPQPPPVGGATVLVQAVLSELQKQSSIRVVPINTSPPPDHFGAKKSKLDSVMLLRMSTILKQYINNIQNCDAVLVFASSRSFFFMIYVPLLRILARWHHKPFFLKPFGGALDQFLAKQVKLIRGYLLQILRSTDGILAETQLLQHALVDLGCKNVHYVPGCRSATNSLKLVKNVDSDSIRIIFLSLIYRKKGPFILLDALKFLANDSSIKVSCDFFGTVLEDKDEFFHALEVIPSAHYCGEIRPEDATSVIAGYDVLVLPTFGLTEGHPGAIIEAMQVGVPVISTRLRAIPELITDGENGFLVPIEDSYALAEAIKRMAIDPSLRERMGKANFLRGKEFRPDIVVSGILDTVFSNGKSVV